MSVIEILQSARPKQWMKNLIIFMPLVFSQHALETTHLLNVIAAFAIFCLLSGAVYIFNDLFDLEDDKQHPLKRIRPLAAGRLAPALARAASFVLAAVSLGLAFLLSFDFL